MTEAQRQQVCKVRRTRSGADITEFCPCCPRHPRFEKYSPWRTACPNCGRTPEEARRLNTPAKVVA